MRQTLWRRSQAEPLPRRDDGAAGSLHPWVERIYGIDFARLAADPEGRAAYRDLQTALTRIAAPGSAAGAAGLRPGGAGRGDHPPPADAVEPVPRPQERPHVEALSSIYDPDHLLKRAVERVVTLLDIENASIILLDEARDELYVAEVADENRVGHERRLRGFVFPSRMALPDGWFAKATR